MTARSVEFFAPAGATFDELCRVRRDHSQVGDFSLMTDSHTVWLSEQPMGQLPKQHFEMSRKDFNRLIRWYLRPQKAIRK